MKKIFASIILIFAILSCSKEKEATVIPELPVTIYIVGKARATVNGTSRPIVWKNGKETFLSSENQHGLANAIVVKNNSSYIVGYLTNTNNKTQGTFWKDNVVQTINVDTSVDTSFLSLSIHNNDVYILGKSNNQVRYWKNGVENTPTGIENAKPIKIIANQNDVYILVSENSQVKLWKNGVVSTMPNPGIYGDDAKDFCIVNNNVYVLGQEIGVRIKYWKNGVVKYISSSSYDADAESINVSNDAVYISGSDDNRKAVYWKNGTPVLAESITSSVIWTSMFFNDKLYSAGYDNYNLGVWKNNSSITPNLNIFEGVPYGIYITN